jgi:hypothetical protein
MTLVLPLGAAAVVPYRDLDPISAGSPLSEDPGPRIFVGDLATGSWSQWTGLHQRPDAALAPAAVLSSPSPPPGASHFGRFELKSGSERSEAYSNFRLRDADDVYFHFFVRLGRGFPAEPPGTWGGLLWQLHHRGTTGSPPIALHVVGDSPGNFALRFPSGKRWWLGPTVDHEAWHEFVIRVMHSEDPEAGFVEVWMDGVQQTMENGLTRQYGATLLDEYNYPKIGYYRDVAITAPGRVDIGGFEISRAPF